MSIDVAVRHPQCCGGHNFQFTYNYTAALREAGMCAWKLLDKLPADIAAIIIGRTLSELQLGRTRCEPLIKGDGEWGSWDDLVEALRELLKVLDTHTPGGTVRVI